MDLDVLYGFCVADNPRDGLHYLFASVDDLLSARDFAAVDRLLCEVDLNQLSLTLIVGFLAITMAAKNKLSERGSYYTKARQYITKIDPKRVDVLLGGLE